MRCQLNGPNALELQGWLASGFTVSLSHSSGKVLPCTTMRWKFATSYPGWADATDAQLVSPPPGASVVHPALGDSGLSERYTCESPLISSTGLPKSVVCDAMLATNGSYPARWAGVLPPRSHMSACARITTEPTSSSSAWAKARSSQRRSAPVRSAISCDWAALLVGAPYQMSASLFEPPGRLRVTNSVSCRSKMTFSTNCWSDGWFR